MGDTKKCFKCGIEKPLSEFYKHSAMADGHLNKCKECTKKDVKANYFSNHDHYQQYEQNRKQRSERKVFNFKCSQRRRQNNPDKYKAQCAVNNAIRDGKLKKSPCQICGSVKRVEAHHEDYSKPLEVIWLCLWCHRKIHKYNQLKKIS